VEGIDDPASRHYNRLVNAPTVAAKDWKSSERMRQAGEVYRWGVVVAHNWDQIPGAGSCIFLHIWERADEPTSGCTAMPAEQMLKVIRWLEHKKHPLLVQLPTAEYQRLRRTWALP
jgi:L,D-peptidoglycan transpeptidase YkuD (ErfK/YbiS/YcfS/YnhG family)